MRAIILAAGQGERMRPLTDTMPKAMLEVCGKPLIQYHVERLVAAGINRIIINHAVFGEQIEEHLGNGGNFNADICYSAEGNLPLETGGGIRNALPLLGNAPFIAVNADVWSDYPFEKLDLPDANLAHLVLVNNPEHNPEGDFSLVNGRVSITGNPLYTFSGIGLYHPQLFEGISEKKFPLAPLLKQAMKDNKVSGEHFTGEWIDAGTPDRLNRLRIKLKE